MSLKLSLFKNAGAGVVLKASTAIIRLIQVPVLIAALGVDDFGRWLVLSSLPTWLMLANLGFGSVASNEISMAVAANDVKEAKRIYSTTLALVLGIAIIGSVLAFGLFPFLPWENFLDVPKERHNEMSFALIWLALSVFVSFSIETFGGRFRAARKWHQAVLIGSLAPWIDLLSIVIALKFSVALDTIALGLLCSTVTVSLIHWRVSKMVMPSITFSTKDIIPSKFIYLFRKGIAFQAFPLGTALLFQGNLLIVQTLLGPTAVAIFSTARTLVRTINQFMEIVNQALWPELSHLFGLRDWRQISKLHSNAVGISVAVSTMATIVFSFFGATIYSMWVGKSISLPPQLLLLFVWQIPFTAFWYTSSVMHLAGNQHEGLAIRSLIAACLAVISCGVLSYFIGLEGAAVSTLVFDLVLIPYVLKHSLQITNDTFRSFMARIFATARSGFFLFKRLRKVNA